MMLQRVDGTTQIVAILGSPLGHSLSPLIHNHVYAALKLPFVYVPCSVLPQELHHALYGLRALNNFAGANVTIPHKQSVLPYCDIVSDLSLLTGTVNTIYMKNGLLHATTTDFEGFVQAMAWMRFELEGSDIAILGNGGTARTFAFALAAQKLPKSLTLIGRDPHKVTALAQEVSLKTGFPVNAGELYSASLKATLTRCSLCVNCTSVGMHPHTDDAPLQSEVLHKNLTVFDTIYNPKETKLLKMAKAAGCAYQNGLRMLIGQALASIGYWSGAAIPNEIIDFKEIESAVTINSNKENP